MTGSLFVFPVEPPRPPAPWRLVFVVVLTLSSAFNAWMGAERDAQVERQLRCLNRWTTQLDNEVSSLRKQRDALARRVDLLEACGE